MEIKRTIDMYNDIIDKPHHVSSKRPHMSMYDRAAQFAPFAALTGHDEAIEETARLTDRRIELSEDEKIELDSKFQYVMEHVGDGTEFEFTYFVPDATKSGGKYITYVGAIRNIDIFKGIITFTDKSAIKIADIVNIRSEEM